MAWYMEFWLPIPTQEHNTETQPVCTAQRLSTNKVGIRWGERTLARSTRSYSASASEFPRKVLKVSERGDWDWDLFGRDVGTGIVQTTAIYRKNSCQIYIFPLLHPLSLSLHYFLSFYVFTFHWIHSIYMQCTASPFIFRGNVLNQNRNITTYTYNVFVYAYLATYRILNYSITFMINTSV